MAIVISILALFVSLASAFASRASARASILGHFVALERSLSDLPRALRFHGISESDLEQAGVNIKEFSYLLASSTIGNFYHRLYDRFTVTAFPVGHYRRAFCESADFRNAWPLIRKMMTPSNFVRRVDATIGQICGTVAPPPAYTSPSEW